MKDVHKRACLTLGGFLLLLGIAFQVLDACFPFPFEALRPSPATQVVDANGSPLRFFLADDDRWRFPVTLNNVSPDLIQTLLASEDRFFYRHPGVNPFSIVRAAVANVANGRVVCGGSTISMQLARLACPRKRTMWAKVVEAFRALQLERAYSKDEILEHYLNMTPYGGNIVGVGAAAWFYFGKKPDALSLGESAMLAIIPKAPTRYDPVRRPKAALLARNDLLQRFKTRNVFGGARIAAAKKHELPKALHKTPLIAPHFARFIRNKYKGNTHQSHVLRTTLDANLQQTVQYKVQERIFWIRKKGLENIAVVVLETGTREVKAMVGSARFFDDEHHGQINGTRIKRSPGSALKPFLYALAFDRGLVVPQSFLYDIPTDYAGYVAKNYDGKYRGRVTVEQALVQSLNSPAVRLLADVGVEDFYGLLRQNGLQTINKPYWHYGLPLVLGACEVTLLDLANAYATLASAGIHRRTRCIAGAKGGKRSKGTRVLSPEACYLTGRILSKVERGEMPIAWSLTKDAPVVAWKTGTSCGHRDAWAVGFSSKYTVGVWVGNLDGKAELGISGAQHAGPILFDVMRALESGATQLPHTNTTETPDWPDSLNVGSIEVCEESRHLPTPYCKERVLVDYLPGKSIIPQDSMHRQIFVDTETGYQLEGACLATRPSKQIIIKEYPLELANWWRSQGADMARSPQLSPACIVEPTGTGPKIVSPNGRTPYRIRPGSPKRFQKITLLAQAPADAMKLFWYQNGKLIAHGTPEREVFIDVEPGKHRLAVMDDRGRVDALTFFVE